MEGRQEALFFEYSRGSVYAGETETLVLLLLSLYKHLSDLIVDRTSVAQHSTLPANPALRSPIISLTRRAYGCSHHV